MKQLPVFGKEFLSRHCYVSFKRDKNFVVESSGVVYEEGIRIILTIVFCLLDFSLVSVGVWLIEV